MFKMRHLTHPSPVPPSWRREDRPGVTSDHLVGNEEAPGHCICRPGGEILLSLPSFGGRLTDRNSREQQGDEVVSGAIDCQLTGGVHYTDRPETQHSSTYVLITRHESLPGTRSLLCFSPLWLFFKTPLYCAFSGGNAPS